MSSKVSRIAMLSCNNQFKRVIGEVLDGYFLIKQGYSSFSVLNINAVSSIKTFELPYDVLINQVYINKVRDQIILYDDNFCLYHINISTGSSSEFAISDEVVFTPFYIWNQQTCLIVDISYKVYELGTAQGLNLISTRDLSKYSFLKKLVELNILYRVLFFDACRKNVVYRTEGECDNLVFLFDFGKSLDINFKAPSDDIHSADYRNSYLVLVHEDYIAFYYTNIQIFRINIRKKLWIFSSAKLIEVKGIMHCVVFSFNVNNPKRNVIEIYKIEK